MRKATPRPWLQWRIALATPTAMPTTALSRAERLRMPLPAATETAKAEKPGPDGIRHELVARIRREIAAGTYDTEEKWLAAEEALLRRIEERI